MATVAERRNERVHDPIDEYLADEQNPRIQRRLAEGSRLPGPQIHLYRRSPASIHTSLLLSGSDSLPAYTNASTHSETHSLSSSFGARQLALRLLQDSGRAGGALEVPQPVHQPGFECPFDFLACLLTFTKFEEWFAHSLTHFSRASPPKTSKCCFCDCDFGAPTGLQCWRERMEHVSLHHKIGCRLATARPDFDMFKYLWDQGLIKNVEYKDLMGRGNPNAALAYPSPPQSPTGPSTPYTITNTNRRRERRR